MTIVLLIPVALIGWGVACALGTWRRLGVIARAPALIASELPFLCGYLLIAAAALAVVRGGVHRVAGIVVVAGALVVLAGLAVIVRRALLAGAALHDPPARRRWASILLAPLPARRPAVVRVPDLAYGEGKLQTLDVSYRRDRPAGVPVVLHLHGGGFRSGSKRHEARPLIGHLADAGMVCVSADYRLLPHVDPQEQIADVLAAIAWVRAHVQDYGGDGERICLVGSSAGAYLAVAAVNAGARGITGIVGRYGYYGNLTLEPLQPPVLVIHGENDLLVPPSHARAFVKRLRDVSGERAEYVELPGAHHNFDRFESIRASAVSIAVERFIVDRSRRRPGRP